MYENTHYNIKIDFNKSKGSYIYDMNSDKLYLDFFNQYSTVPLGYNHHIFDDTFDRIMYNITRNKIVNDEIITQEGEEFYKMFKEFPGKEYKDFHFCNTGGLAVESAIKHALDRKDGKIASVENSFHGITGLGMFATKPFDSIKNHMIDISHKKFISINNQNDVTSQLKNENNISAIIIEPIQSTYGDNYLTKEYIEGCQEYCNNNDCLLIFDEIQTGFGSTGKMWYYKYFNNIHPDVIIFGKKSHVCGIMTNDAINHSLQSVTWDGNLIDMVRCKYVMKAIKKYNLLENIINRGNEIHDIIDGYRGVGGIGCIEFDNENYRDKVYSHLYKNNVICNKTRNHFIRFRLNLAITKEETKDFNDRYENSDSYRIKIRSKL